MGIRIQGARPPWRRAKNQACLMRLASSQRSQLFGTSHLGGAMASFAGYGIGQFVPPFWIRAHGFDLMTAALIFGGVLGVAAGIGTFGSGIVADRVRARHPNSDSWLPALGLFLCVPLAVFGYNTLSFTSGALAVGLAIPALAAAAILRYSYLAPMFAVTQKLVEPRMRATAAALMLFIVNLIGYGGGPPVIGWISDQGTKWQLSQFDAPVSIDECGTIEAALKAARDGLEGAPTGADLEDAGLLNGAFCAPARSTGVRWGRHPRRIIFPLGLGPLPSDGTDDAARPLDTKRGCRQKLTHGRLY